MALRSMVETKESGAERIHRIGAMEVDEALHQVRNDDAIVAVEPKPFELLVFLIRQRHRVVSRDELMAALWPGVIVSEATLSSAVRRARAAIAPQQELIQGIRKVGYRFIGDVEHRVVASGAATTAILGARATDTSPASAATPYVGRERELAELGAALDRGLAGNGSFIAIAGEPGVGKTRTIDELRQHAVARGVEVLVGRCYEGDGGQAFWPWVQVFRAFAANRNDEALAAAVAGEASDIARLTSAIAAPADSAPLADPEMLRARLFDAAVVVLRRTALRSPLVIVLDDLHWADNASLTLLLAIARQLSDVPLVVIGAFRELELGAAHPLGSLLTTLRHEQVLQRVVLTGLTHAEASTLLQATAGAPVDQDATAAVFAATEGNPFYLLEYWRDLEEAGLVERGAHGWERRDDFDAMAVPEGVAETIDRRLRRLSPECVRLLTIAAVVGREFSYELLSEVTTSEPHETIELLDAAAAARVIDEIIGEPGSYRFAHALIRQTLIERLTTLRRAALHRYVGEALEKRSPSAPTRTWIAELAHHFLRAGPAGAGRKAIDYAGRAAAAAMQSLAYDAAVAYLDQAVAIADQLASNGDASDVFQQCELHLLLAESLAAAGDGTRMRTSFERTAELARAIPAPTLLARVAVGLTRNTRVEDEAAVHLCEEALTLLPAEDIALRAQVQASLAKALYLFDGTHERRRQLCTEARESAARSGDAYVLGEVLADALEAEFNCDGLTEQDNLSAALCEVTEVTDDARLRLLGRAWQIVNRMRRGQLHEADARVAEFSQLASDLRQPRFLHHAAAFEAALLLARGHLAEAEARSAEALRLGTRIDAASAAWLHWAQLHHLRREQGRFAEFIGEGLALRLPPGTHAAYSYERSYRWAAPHVFSELGREAEAKASFAALMAGGLDALPPDNARNTRIAALFSLSDACATVGDAPAAALIYARLLPYADHWHVIGWGTVVFGSSHIMLGTLRGVERRWDEAIAHFEEAIRQHDEQAAVCAQARTLYQFARMLQRRGGRKHEQQARTLIARGLSICDEFSLNGAEVRLRRLLSGA